MKIKIAVALLSFGLGTMALAQTGGAKKTPEGEGQQMAITRAGTQASSKGPAQNFTGSVRVAPLFAEHAPSTASGAAVTFEPGARSAWHTHPKGQVLIVTAGVGRVQQWGGPVQELRPGDVVWTPPGVLIQLRSLHHWAGRPGSEERVTFNSARDYFGRGHEMGVNNSLFADRLNFVAKAQKQAAAEARPVVIGTLVEQAVRELPGSAVEPT